MMRKLTRNIRFITLLLLSTGSSIAMGKNDAKFEWDATESAPKHYPMEIIRGTFIYHGEAEAGLYIPSGGTLSSGWGDPISSHDVGEKFKPLPDRLKIYFFSLAERQFYEGEFALPYERIQALFREGVANATASPDGELPIYTRIMAGVAPGGVVAVWVTGQDTKEVFFGQAQKVELNPSAAFALPFKDKADSDSYMQEILESSTTPEERESIKKNGIPFGLWARYRNLYDWLPNFTQGHHPEKVNAIYLNGEYIVNWNPGDKKELDKLRPVPQEVRFMTTFNEEKVLFTVNFDEFETMAAFEKLGANGKKVYIEFEPRMPRTDIKIRVYNDKESIELKKFISKK
jgi:hypothetical protein